MNENEDDAQDRLHDNMRADKNNRAASGRHRALNHEKKLSNEEIFEETKSNWKAMATITQELLGDEPYPDPRHVSKLFEDLSLEAYWKINNELKDKLAAYQEFMPILISIMLDQVELEKEVYRRVTS